MSATFAAALWRNAVAAACLLVVACLLVAAFLLAMGQVRAADRWSAEMAAEATATGGAAMSDQAYIGRKACGCAVAVAVVDPSDPGQARNWARDLRWWRRDGLAVEEATVKGVRATRFGCRCRPELRRRLGEDAAS